MKCGVNDNVVLNTIYLCINWLKCDVLKMLWIQATRLCQHFSIWIFFNLSFLLIFIYILYLFEWQYKNIFGLFSSLVLTFSMAPDIFYYEGERSFVGVDFYYFFLFSFSDMSLDQKKLIHNFAPSFFVCLFEFWSNTSNWHPKHVWLLCFFFFNFCWNRFRFVGRSISLLHCFFLLFLALLFA